jgi:hypothetical protein
MQPIPALANLSTKALTEEIGYIRLVVHDQNTERHTREPRIPAE